MPNYIFSSPWLLTFRCLFLISQLSYDMLLLLLLLLSHLQSCPTLCDPVDGSPAGSLVPGILQARILEWVAISFSNLMTQQMSKELCIYIGDILETQYVHRLCGLKDVTNHCAGLAYHQIGQTSTFVTSMFHKLALLCHLYTVPFHAGFCFV